MRFFWGSDEGDRVPETIAGRCLGKACPNFMGEPCDVTQMNLMFTGPPSQDGSESPFSEVACAVYGQYCLASTGEDVVAGRIEVPDPDAFDDVETLITLAHLSTSIPIEIVLGGSVLRIDPPEL